MTTVDVFVKTKVVDLWVVFLVFVKITVPKRPPELYIYYQWML